MSAVLWDSATLRMEQSESVPVESVRVEVCVSTSITPDEIRGIVPAIRHTLREITRIEWEILGMRHWEDPVGTVCVFVHAAVHIPAEQILGLAASLDACSRDGFRVGLMATRYRAQASVLHESIERAHIRLYEHVHAQLCTMNEALPERSRPWTLADVSVSTDEGENFKRVQVFSEHMSGSELMQLPHPGGEDDDFCDDEPLVLKLTSRMTVHAYVTFRRPLP